MNIEEQTLEDAVREARACAIDKMIEAAERLKANPNHFDSYSEIQKWLDVYVDAQHILRPTFFS